MNSERRRLSLALVIWAATALLPGCSSTPQRGDYPLGYVERGVASWYGPGFHGKRTANGERFDMNRLTAAHRTLPMGSVVQVKFLSTGRIVTVRINDRGPFARGRIIDLSHEAAKNLGMTGVGTAEVELRVVGYEGRAGALGYLRVQVGSFAEEGNARALAGRLRGSYGDVRIQAVDLASGRRWRVLVGQFTSEGQAQAVADRIGSQFELEPLVLRDDT